MHGKPSNLTAESYNEQIEKLVALKSALASATCVESFDVNVGENGRIRGRVSLRHSEPFYQFNEIVLDHPVSMAGVYSEDRVEDTPDGSKREVAEIRVLVVEE
ncbi:hypothetical protein [Natrinema ejinorense]|uniref:Uncharacterized protein n=1 Tax=Natrinema ejinorense TaxID=373386 RepID=A0A2A5QP75_9EURY|nr:hypothetical protein [Natrinema ejinorense]PCR88627.1 hypothetical protein CP557_21575 [Natrinema ejinorense]